MHVSNAAFFTVRPVADTSDTVPLDVTVYAIRQRPARFSSAFSVCS